jgi:H+-translocating NAD(P) transhydrogenase subunit alpha
MTKHTIDSRACGLKGHILVGNSFVGHSIFWLCLIVALFGDNRMLQAQSGAAPAVSDPSTESLAAETGDVAATGGVRVADNAAVIAAGSEPLRWGRRETLLASITVLLLSVFLGFELITKVPPTLHTPLMSGSNAISGITVVGALLVAGAAANGWLVSILAALAVAMATINVVGGFAVTHRMLSMFRRK